MDSVKIAIKYLNIDVSSMVTIELIEAEINSIPSNEIPIFMEYLRINCHSEKLKYKSSFGKLTYLVDFFKKQRSMLNDDEALQITLDSEKLFNKITSIYEAIKDELYKNNVSVFSDKGKNYINNINVQNDIKNFVGENDYKICEIIGHIRIITLLDTQKKLLQEEIISTMQRNMKTTKSKQLGYITNKTYNKVDAIAHNVASNLRVD